ncbi:MAG: branched-chain amino acid ABC transporter permease [Alphaproteobacteria bacterium]|nr:branched-chain amino acid ABC transporter permease [Alphaproteobacteria bacterium]MBU0798427.1 branched-chain amino acid ABC transporter permease [Alphaproteobacteria bacterium]MBU0889106.1 branched-chain amino acid ABC transporter permease [Alphaproteobacteria bacterium]MBU1813289.1 branched-chain amino acid ABC transporter permease [Alphaproteobacteria bacterium]
MTRRHIAALGVALWFGILALTPLLADNYTIRIAITIAMYSAMALSWNFIGGFAGYPSFSTAAFFGIGCYVGAIAQRSGVPLVVAWALATVFVTVFAVALGAIILRLKGHYFAIGSIAIVEVVRLVVSSWGGLTGGGDGLNVPLLSGGPDRVATTVLYVMLAIMLAAFVVTILVDRARLGFGLRCISQNEDAADMVGIDTTRYKIAAYALSALFCGTVGAVYASWVGYIDPTDSFSILLSVKVPVMVLLGGAGTVLGPIIGAGAFVMLEEFFWANFLEWNRAILGGIIVFLIFFLPSGILKLDYRRLFRRKSPVDRTEAA